MEIKRLVYKDLRREIAEPEILVLTGPRQVGKTTLLHRLERDARDAGRRTRFLDLEQPADLATLAGADETVIQALIRDVDVVFVDEFYYLEDAGRLFKAVFDRGRAGRPVKIVASGSSSVEIHGHLKESLAGRTITYRVFPLLYDEYRAWDSEARPDLETYLRFGGLPGLAEAGDEGRKQRLLNDYLSTYLFKDVKGLVREENIRAFNQLLYLLAQNQGQLLEVSRLAGDLRLSAPTVTRYLDVLDQTYVNFLVPSYHTNLANELRKSRKAYLYDLGVRNGILKDFRPPAVRDDRGAILESHVFLTLRALLAPNMELRFWRTKKQVEVDFVLVCDRQPFPVEVKSTWSRRSPPSGVADFCQRYPSTRATFTVSETGAEPVRDGDRTHHFLPLERVSDIVSLLP